MKNLILITLLGLAFTACGQKNNQTSDALILGNINGGASVATDSNFAPYTVGIITTGVGRCTGSIIGRDLILTAAHCIDKAPAANVTVIFGSDIDHGIKIQAKDVLVHEKYRNLRNDLAMIRLQQDIPDNFKVLDLEDSRQINLSSNDKVTTLGYGVFEYATSTGAGPLREAKLSIEKYENDGEFVILNQKVGPGICYGDSGGPTFTIVNERVALVGVASNVRETFYGRKDGCINKAVLTNPNYFYNWINTTKLKI